MKALQKDTLREIKKTMSRFLSIVVIIALGVCFYAGIKTTGPSEKYTAEQYFSQSKLADIHLISTWGFTEEDIRALNQVEGIAQAEGTYTADVIAEIGDKRPVVKAYALPEAGDLNQVMVTEGRLPENAKECVLEAPSTEAENIAFYELKIGDTLKLSPEVGSEKLSDMMTEESYTIVGFIRSPQYISIERGTTTVGSGSVSYYAMMLPEVFKSERYTDAYLYTKESSEGLSPYSNDYTETINALETELETVGQDRLTLNYEDIKNTAELELNKGRRELKDAQETFDTQIAEAETTLAEGEAELVDAQDKLTAGEDALAQAKKTYADKIAEAERTLKEKGQLLEEGEAKLAEGQAQYAEGIAQYEAGKAAFDLQKPEAEAQIAAGEAGLEKLSEGITALKAQIAALEKMDPQTPEIEAMLKQLKGELAGYEKQYSEAKAQVEAGKAALASGEKQLSDSKAELEAAKAQLESSAQTIADGKVQLSEGWNQLETEKAKGQAQLDAAQAEIDKGYAQLAEGQKALNEGRAELEEKRAEGQKKLDEAAQAITDGEKEIADLEFGKWYIFNRGDNPGYTAYGQDADRIDSLSGIFPVFFLLVAVLVSFTTMTRMVEEQRMEIGTLKALGYTPLAIASKFITYALSASLVGCIIGAVVGVNSLPRLIITAYSLLYQMPNFQISVPFGHILVSCLVALVCTVGAAVMICVVELREQPSELMRPKAPKIGKRILLEKVPIIWNHMSFISKVTARNIMRYKGRFFMTVVGIAGCTALILAGFGLQDSIFSIVPKQFEEISVYDGMMALKNEGTLAEKGAIIDTLKADDRIASFMLAKQLQMSVAPVGENNRSKEAYLFVPSTPEAIGDFVNLRHREDTETPITLGDSGAVISEKLARDLGIDRGDTIKMYNEDGDFEIKVEDITENYIEHYVYISPTAYKAATGKEVSYNLIDFNLKDESDSVKDAVGTTYLENSQIISVSFIGNLVESTNDSMSSLNVVVIVMLVSAGALAFVVLYNLTNINVSERVREIATIRVLGFYDREVNNYIFRENIVLSLVGMVVGLVLGVFLNDFIIKTVETDIVMFGRGIEPSSFLWSCLFTMLFTLIVNITMAPVIKRVDMVESLKSIE